MNAMLYVWRFLLERKIKEMSKYINEIVQDIRTNPKSWKRKGDYGLQKGNISIEHCGNGTWWFLFYLLSIVQVTINGIESNLHHLSPMDKVRLERTFNWWLRNASLDMLT